MATSNAICNDSIWLKDGTFCVVTNIMVDPLGWKVFDAVDVCGKVHKALNITQFNTEPPRHWH